MKNTTNVVLSMYICSVITIKGAEPGDTIQSNILVKAGFYNPIYTHSLILMEIQRNIRKDLSGLS